jgi:IclR family acetate operon transcriptional repressor
MMRVVHAESASARTATQEDGASSRRTLATAVHITEALSIIAEAPQGVPAKVLARRLDQSLSSTYYALQTLASLGLVEPSPCSPGLYTLGPRIAELYRGYVANRTLPERLAPLLSSMRERTRARSYLASWSNGDLEITHALGRRGAAELQDVSPGFRGAAHALALGKVLLTATRRERWPDYLQRARLQAFTDNTISRPGRLHLELQEVRAKGFAVDREEYQQNVCCIAFPVQDSAGRVLSAIAISVSARRFGREFPELRRAVAETAAEASQVFSRLDPLTAMVRETAAARA